MKAAAFQQLLASVRDVGAYMRGNRTGVARTDQILLEAGRRQMTSPKIKRKVPGSALN